MKHELIVKGDDSELRLERHTGGSIEAITLSRNGQRILDRFVISSQELRKWLSLTDAR